MATLISLIKEGSEHLSAAGITDSDRDSRKLLLHVLDKELSFFYSDPEFEITENQQREFEQLVKRRVSREPIQHILGTQEFFGLEFEVNPSVLIPRPETEILVSAVLKEYSDLRKAFFADIGTGSGCIAVSLLTQLPDARCVASDISDAALTVANRNAENLGVSERLELVRSDLFNVFEPVEYDFVVSNPPYVPLNEYEDLQPEVRDFDPRNAVTEEEDGLSLIDRLAKETGAFLKPNGSVFIEFGFGQEKAIREVFLKNGWQVIKIIDDLSAIPRVLHARKGG